MNKKIEKYTLIGLIIIFSILLYIEYLINSFDNDIYFEIVSGNDLLAGNFSTASHVSNIPIIVQQWLYSVCLAIADKFNGVYVFVIIQHIILCIVSYVFIYMKTNDKKKAIISPFILILLCHGYMINARPQIITVICLIVELILVELYKKTHKYRYLLLVIPILILHANLHQAVFLYSILVLLPYYIDNKKIDLLLVGITPLYMLCSLCTPYGINGAIYVFNTFMSGVFSNLIKVQEIQPITILSGKILIITVAITIYLIYKHRSNKYINTYIFLVFLLSMWSARHTSILYIPLLYIICAIDSNKLKNTYILYAWCSILIVLVYIMSLKTPDNYYIKNIPINDKYAIIYNLDYDIGGYLEYNGYYNVTFDSRYELYTETFCGEPKLETAKKLNTLYNSNQFLTDEQYLDLLPTCDYVIIRKTAYGNIILSKYYDVIYTDDYRIIYEVRK